jgi:2,4-dienoyl-CoA reductase (NADPH2)
LGKKAILTKYYDIRSHYNLFVYKIGLLDLPPKLDLPLSMFKNLLSPLDLGFMTLDNRTVMGSMHTGLEEAKKGYYKMAVFYAERVKGGVGLIITGGVSPNRSGWLVPFGSKMTSQSEVEKHKIVTSAVRKEGGKICLQLLHAGRYANHPFCVAPSSLKSPISPYKPWTLSPSSIRSTIQDFANAAFLAKEAGYHGVEIMGSEGYLINQFLAPRTNQRQDSWGGSIENRVRFAKDIVERTRQKVGEDFLIIFRLSLLDLVENGNNWDEIIFTAKTLEEAGVNIFNSGIGWHESRIPTIATLVPNGAFTWATAKLKKEVNIPVITTNRINTPEKAESILSSGQADLVSMARPFLADPYFVKKAQEGNSNLINTCIACNQACLDNIFSQKIASCMVNPEACRETELKPMPLIKKKKIAIIGAGPAGLSTAIAAGSRGHEVHIFEAKDEIGGQFNLARRIPGKEDYAETLRYYNSKIQLLGIKLYLSTPVDEEMILNGEFDEVVMSSGVMPRKLKLSGIENSKVVYYDEAILNPEKLGKNIAIIGAGGVGVDTATALLETQNNHSSEEKLSHFLKYWGVDTDLKERGSLIPPIKEDPKRKIFLLQRSKGKIGNSLGKTTSWIHRLMLKKSQVEIISEVEYEKIDNEGLHYKLKGETKILNVDNIVICAGQDKNNWMIELLNDLEISVHVIGGAKEAKDLDAVRAIEEGTRLGYRL